MRLFIVMLSNYMTVDCTGKMKVIIALSCICIPKCSCTECILMETHVLYAVYLKLLIDVSRRMELIMALMPRQLIS